MGIMAVKKLRYDGWRKKIKYIQIRGGPGNLVTKWLVFLGGGGGWKFDAEVLKNGARARRPDF